MKAIHISKSAALASIGVAFAVAAILTSIPQLPRAVAGGQLTKAQRDQYYQQLHQQALQRPRAPKNPYYRPPRVVEQIPTGVIGDYSNAPLDATRFVPTSGWQDFVGNRFVQAWAGSSPTDSTLGMVVLESTDAGDRVSHGQEQTFTHGNGPLTIVSSVGAIVVMHDSFGTNVKFNVASDTFV